MATFKTVVMKQRVDGFFPVYIRITHNRDVSCICPPDIQTGIGGF